MAALSVQRLGAAKRSSSPARSQPNDICARSSPLQLTPPLTVTSCRPASARRRDRLGDQDVDHRALERSAKVARRIRARSCDGPDVTLGREVPRVRSG